MDVQSREFNASIQDQIQFLKAMHKVVATPVEINLLPVDSSLRKTISTLAGVGHRDGIIKAFSAIIRDPAAFDTLQPMRQRINSLHPLNGSLLLWDSPVRKVFTYSEVVRRFRQYSSRTLYRGGLSKRATEWCKLLQFFPFKRLYLNAMVQENQGMIAALGHFYDSFADYSNVRNIIYQPTYVSGIIAVRDAFSAVMRLMTSELLASQWQPAVYLLEQLVKANVTVDQVVAMFTSAEVEMQKGGLQSNKNTGAPCRVAESCDVISTIPAKSVTTGEPTEMNPAASTITLQAIPWKSWLIEQWEDNNGESIHLVTPGFHIEINCHLQDAEIRKVIVDLCRQLAMDHLFPVRPKVAIAYYIQYIQEAITCKPAFAQDPSVVALDTILKSTIGASLIPAGIDKQVPFDYKKIVEERNSHLQRKVDIWVSRKYNISVSVYSVISRELRGASDSLNMFKSQFHQNFVSVYERKLHTLYVESVVRACQEMIDNLSKPASHLAVTCVLESLPVSTQEQVKKQLVRD